MANRVEELLTLDGPRHQSFAPVAPGNAVFVPRAPKLTEAPLSDPGPSLPRDGALAGQYEGPAEPAPPFPQRWPRLRQPPGGRPRARRTQPPRGSW